MPLTLFILSLLLLLFALRLGKEACDGLVGRGQHRDGLMAAAGRALLRMRGRRMTRGEGSVAHHAMRHAARRPLVDAGRAGRRRLQARIEASTVRRT